MSKALYLDKNFCVNKDLLNAKVKESGLRIDYILDILGLTYEGFSKKCNGKIPIKPAEMYVLCDLLPISAEEKPKIFTQKVETKCTT